MEDKIWVAKQSTILADGPKRTIGFFDNAKDANEWYDEPRLPGLFRDIEVVNKMDPNRIRRL